MQVRGDKRAEAVARGAEPGSLAGESLRELTRTFVARSQASLVISGPRSPAAAQTPVQVER